MDANKRRRSGRGNKRAQPGSEQQKSQQEVMRQANKHAEQQESEALAREPESSIARNEPTSQATKDPGGKRVAEHNREGIFESLTKANEALFSLDGVKKAAAWYIETGQKLANQALELQEKATTWAKDTPLAPLFEAQNSFARKFVERSVNAARTLWQIQSA